MSTTTPIKNITNEYIGAMCANFRKYKLNVTQQCVADDCGVSRELVSKFERGMLPNSLVFFWYIKNGIFDWSSYDEWRGWAGVDYGKMIKQNPSTVYGTFVKKG